MAALAERANERQREGVGEVLIVIIQLVVSAEDDSLSIKGSTGRGISDSHKMRDVDFSKFAYIG